MSESRVVTERRGRFDRLAAGEVDVLVIGGGITGAGVALDAASRGLSVALVEQADFAEGTSSRSTKLVHGGLRYLPMLDIAQVRDDLAERDLLLRNAPHLVRPIPFVLPLYAGARRPLGLRLPSLLRVGLPLGLDWGLWAYDFMAGAGHAGKLRRHRRLSREAAAALVPPMRLDGFRQAYIYYDAVTDDARLVMTVLRTAMRRGAIAVNYAQAEGLVTDAGRVSGARVRDHVTGQTVTVRARTTVNATGIWAETLARQAGQPAFRVRRAKGVHLVVPHNRLRLGRTAFVLPETDDGRLGFVIPWHDVVLIGTTDTEWDGSPENPPIEERDVAYLLDHASRFLTTPLTRADVLGAYAGLRPLVSRARADGTASARLSRRHEVVPSGEGFVTIVGGKLTTYRRMAEDTVNCVLHRHAGTVSPTRTLLLDGAEGLAEELPRLRDRARRLGLSRRAFLHLVRTHGTSAGMILDVVAERPALGETLAEGHAHIAAEVVWAVRQEMAVAVADVLLRRTGLAHMLPGHGTEIGPRVAALMGDELGWTPDTRAEQMRRYAQQAAALALPSPAGGDRPSEPAQRRAIPA
jgi:glycerol-3-phosphate dehydrogenase